MLIQQYMCEFNTLVGPESFKMSSENQLTIRRKLDIVIPMFSSTANDEIDSIPAITVDDFVRNLQKILNLSLMYSIDNQIVNSSMKFLSNVLTGHENRVRSSILREIKYPVFVSILCKSNFSENDKGQTDLLVVIREICKHEKIIDEHNIKLLIAAFEDSESVQSANENVVKMFAEVS